MTTLKLSRYFTNLASSYNAELDDLRTDSEGNNVLKARLTKKREQLPQLLMMMAFSPEMVAVAFHGAFFFTNTLALESLITKEANKFPTWATIHKAVTIEPWAQPLVDLVLKEPEGEAFLITTVGLEYLNRSNQSRAAQMPVIEEDEEQEENEVDDNDTNLYSDDEGETTEFDLDQAGADWLAEQGFDRKE